MRAASGLCRARADSARGGNISRASAASTARTEEPSGRERIRCEAAAKGANSSSETAASSSPQWAKPVSAPSASSSGTSVERCWYAARLKRYQTSESPR